MVKHLSEDTFENTLAGEESRVLVDFYADWCGPCQMMGPLVEELSEEMADNKFYKVNVDECPNLAKKYGVMSIPTFIAFENGQPVKKQLGAMPKEDLEELLK